MYPTGFMEWWMVNKTQKGGGYPGPLYYKGEKETAAAAWEAALKSVEVVDTSHNKPCASALWRELNRGCPKKVPLKTDWVPVTEKRLHSALKRLNVAQG